MKATLKLVWGSVFVAVFGATTVILVFLSWHPPVGVYIAAVALLTIFQGENNKLWQRSLLITVIVCLVLLEISSIYKDRKEHDKELAAARTEQLIEFGEIATRIGQDLKQNEIHFDATMSRLDTTLDRVGDSIKTQTGGDSFAFIAFTAEPAQNFDMRWGNFLAPRGKAYFLISVTSQGKYPLRDIRAIMMDDERRFAAMQEYNDHPTGDWMQAINSADTEYRLPYLRPQSPEAPQGEVDVIGTYPMAERDFKRITISFSAPNGYWSEALHLGHVNGIWHQCLSIMG